MVIHDTLKMFILAVVAVPFLGCATRYTALKKDDIARDPKVLVYQRGCEKPVVMSPNTGVGVGILFGAIGGGHRRRH